MNVQKFDDKNVEKFLSARGNFVSVSFCTEKSPAAKHKGVVLRKLTKGVFRAGINYANLKPVKEGIEAGTRGEVGQLPWGATWAMFPYIIVKDNEYYIRLYPSVNKPQVTYFVNEKVVDKKEFAEFLTPSERAKLLEPKELLCFNVKSSNIITICDNEKK